MKEIPFFQAGPELGNQFDADPVLRNHLKRLLPSDILSEIEPDLRRMGERTVSDISQLGREAELNPPQHIPNDPWGRRIDQVQVSWAWRELDRISAQEGLVAIAYERKYGAWSRLYQFAKLYLFHPSSAFYTCPLAMTDGAARALELYGDVELKKRAFDKLTSRHPESFWTSGQWMTERTGGSDVGETSTIARSKNGHWELFGDKWFTSSISSQMALTLARPEGAETGSQGLSLFYLETFDSDGKLNHIVIQRLKEKMGTKALPTAELRLEGTPALPIGELGHGVKKIASLFNITRVHNSIYAASYMRRGLALARDYAFKRIVFGKTLSQTPLHLETMAEMEVEFRAGFALAFRLTELLGRVENGEDGPGESILLRILTPLAKLFTGKQAVCVLGEIAECFGGAGYVEDTGIPVLLRDAHVLPIWEGTTNVLSMDVLRACRKDAAMEPFLADVRNKLNSVQSPRMETSVEKVRKACCQIEEIKTHEDAAFQNAGARAFSMTLARVYCATLLLEQAQWEITHGGGELATTAALRWCAQPMVSIPSQSAQYWNESSALALQEGGSM